MSIKKRLFISNLLMILVPLFLVMAIMVSMVLFVIGVIKPGPVADSGNVDALYSAAGKINSIADEFTTASTEEGLTQEIQQLNSYWHNRFFAAVYLHNSPLMRPADTTPSTAETTVLSMPEGSLAIVGTTAAYMRKAGPYTLILVDNNYPSLQNIKNYSYEKYAIRASFFVMGIFIVITLGTNLILTRFVSKSIMGPLNTLVHGVHQIRDGELGYRIEYKRKDEFAVVCDDFNEMAVRLQQMVNDRLKDNENRKQLVAGISHDLRTPLTSIKAYVEGLETGVASTPALQKRYLQTIRQKTEDLEHIVSQLFLFSRLDVGEFPFDLERIDLGSNLTNFLEGVAVEYRQKGLAISLDTNVQGVYTMADPAQLRSAITNILENSVKYAVPHTNNACMHVQATAHATYTQLRFTDNGPGVPEEYVQQLFDIFYRVDSARTNPSKGSGLGLAITAKVLEGFGGSIRAENASNGGLSIIITLPVVAEGRQ